MSLLRERKLPIKYVGSRPEVDYRRPWQHLELRVDLEDFISQVLGQVVSSMRRRWEK